VLGDHLAFPIILSKDLERSRVFYQDTLGLEILRRDEDRIVLTCGSGSQLVETLSTTGTSDSGNGTNLAVAEGVEMPDTTSNEICADAPAD
jgi:catechol 2,3-dioxygenase-like lactoylglutathione lyase family enzyme